MKLTTSVTAIFGVLFFIFAQHSPAAQSGQTSMKVVVEPGGISPALDQAIAITPEAAPSAGAAPALSGAWSNNGGGPALYSKNFWYGLILQPVGTLPANATITRVVWSYGVPSHPRGFQALLCHNGNVQYCGDITSWGAGSTSDFFSGRSANSPMAFYFRVVGSGTLHPVVYGQNDSVVVNWTAP